MKPARPTFYKILFASLLYCLFTPVSIATEISELEEITMQVLEKESVENMEIQQMIRIPSPLAPSTSLHSNSGAEVTLKSKTDPMNKSKPENTKTVPK